MNRGNGFWRTVMAFITGLFALGCVFLIGLLFGGFVIFAGMMGADLENGLVTSTVREGSRSTIAIISVEGTIDSRQADYVQRAVDRVIAEPYEAVVLRVDSPGGGVTASDQVWYEVSRLKDAGIPVIASYGSIATSGGYYISCASDFIMAEETCITGSIGVQAQILTLGGLMDKVGIEPVTLAASGSPRKNVANDRYRQWTDEDRAEVIKMLDAAYEIFHRRVRDGRGHVISDPAMIDALADGSIYTAQQATGNGLIDGVGYLEDAIAQAEKLAALAVGQATVVQISEPPDFSPADLLFMRGDRSGKSGPLDAEAIRSLVNDLSTPRVNYLMR
ncbi:MAG: signal peptide peptidase SppA [Phycisphaerales bacterium]|nr:MAG: signal peptide peptidase SppA [Phycisphaerales bacterium]